MSLPAGDELARTEAQATVRALRTRITELDQDALDLILTDARSHYAWQDRPVSDELLHRLYEITAQGPTSMNSCPARFVFVTSQKGKVRLAKSLKAKNIDKMMAAAVAKGEFDNLPGAGQPLDLDTPAKNPLIAEADTQVQGCPKHDNFSLYWTTTTLYNQNIPWVISNLERSSSSKRIHSSPSFIRSSLRTISSSLLLQSSKFCRDRRTSFVFSLISRSEFVLMSFIVRVRVCFS